MIRFITPIILGVTIGVGFKLNPIASGFLCAGFSLTFDVIESMIKENK